MLAVFPASSQQMNILFMLDEAEKSGIISDANMNELFHPPNGNTPPISVLKKYTLVRFFRRNDQNQTIPNSGGLLGGISPMVGGSVLRAKEKKDGLLFVVQEKKQMNLNAEFVPPDSIRTEMKNEPQLDLQSHEQHSTNSSKHSDLGRVENDFQRSHSNLTKSEVDHSSMDISPAMGLPRPMESGALEVSARRWHSVLLSLPNVLTELWPECVNIFLTRQLALKEESSINDRDGLSQSLHGIALRLSTANMVGNSSGEANHAESELFTISPSMRMNHIWQMVPSSTTVSRSPLREDAVVKMIRDTCGPMWRASSENVGQHSFSWKMSLAIYRSAFGRSAKSFKAWAIALRQEFSARAKLVPRIDENDSLHWPTPVANDDNKTPEAHLAMKQRMGVRDGTHSNRTAITSLQVKVQNWPTATANPDAPNTNANQKNMPPSLGKAAEAWQTPTSENFRGRGGARKNEAGLDRQARLWPTPTGSDAKSSGAEGYSTESGRHTGTTLTDAAKAWPTPRAEDAEFAGGHRGTKDTLVEAARSSGIEPPQKENWPTPQERDYKSGDIPGSQNYARKVKQAWTLDLNTAAEEWPTPRASEAEHSGRVVAEHDGQVGLTEAANQWATPTSRDWKDGSNPSENVPTNCLLGRQGPRSGIIGDESSNNTPISRPRSEPFEKDEVPKKKNWNTPRFQDSYERSNRKTVQAAHRGEAQMTLTRQVRGPQGARARLNPNFVEWLMGLPPGWADFTPPASIASGRSAMLLFHLWRHTHSLFLRAIFFQGKNTETG